MGPLDLPELIDGEMSKKLKKELVTLDELGATSIEFFTPQFCFKLCTHLLVFVHARLYTYPHIRILSDG